jgi:DNA-binding NtrC family response regulator
MPELVNMKTILIVDSNENDRITASVLLADKYDVHCCSTAQEALAIARRTNPSAVLLDMASAKTGEDCGLLGSPMNLERKASIVCTVSITAAREDALRRGASAFVQKPYQATALVDAVRLAVAQSDSGRIACQPARGAAVPNSCQAIPHERILLGNSVAIGKVSKRIALYAVHDAPVLILGESGTGKELAAVAIHKASKRHLNRFLPVDCAAIPETLVESILFGTVKGAFTGAVERKGVFENARGGTVFLDEIGELSLSIQAKFLRTLETGSGARLGSVDQVEYDVRILAATNAPFFGDEIRFRPELVHRIDTLILEMPPLRDHKEDIALLIESFLTEFSPGKRLSEEAHEKITVWDWPGNVRELKNVIRRAIVLSGTHDEISMEDVEINVARKAWQASFF